MRSSSSSQKPKRSFVRAIKRATIPVLVISLAIAAVVGFKTYTRLSRPTVKEHGHRVCGEDGDQCPIDSVEESRIDPHDSTVIANVAAMGVPSVNSAHQSRPRKFAVANVGPRKYQWYRGTCWDFATIGMLEHHHRAQGIEQGFMEEDEYTQFSEQAYGKQIVELCASGPSEHQTCVFAGDDVAIGNTEGGEVPLLAYFGREISDGLVLPHSVCPYTKNPGNGTVCPHMEEALKHNPVHFRLTDFSTYYDRDEIRDALAFKRRALAISTPVFNTAFYVPCVGEFANDAECASRNGQCQTYCPVGSSFYPSPCCKKVSGSMYNMDGEFFSHDGVMEYEGGHAMLLVGYSDLFVTRAGYRGGYIIRNSWADGLQQQGPRGSHSIAFFLGQISDTDEREICPNDNNPYNWYPCTGKDCLDTNTIESAAAMRQQLKLRCLQESSCDLHATYYALNMTEVGSTGLHRACFVKQTGKDNFSTECMTPALLTDIALAMEPVEVRKNNKDLCGYYFMPYEVAERAYRRFGGFFVNGFDVEFDDCSYSANAHKSVCKSYDYKWLESSSGRQDKPAFHGPYPGKRVRLN